MFNAKRLEAAHAEIRRLYEQLVNERHERTAQAMHSAPQTDADITPPTPDALAMNFMAAMLAGGGYTPDAMQGFARNAWTLVPAYYEARQWYADHYAPMIYRDQQRTEQSEQDRQASSSMADPGEPVPTLDEIRAAIIADQERQAANQPLQETARASHPDLPFGELAASENEA